MIVVSNDKVPHLESLNWKPKQWFAIRDNDDVHSIAKKTIELKETTIIYSLRKSCQLLWLSYNKAQHQIIAAKPIKGSHHWKGETTFFGDAQLWFDFTMTRPGWELVSPWKSNVEGLRNLSNIQECQCHFLDLVVCV